MLKDLKELGGAMSNVAVSANTVILIVMVFSYPFMMFSFRETFMGFIPHKHINE